MGRSIGIGALLIAGTAGADTIIVSPGESIAAAAQMAQEGDEIVVEPGTFIEPTIQIFERDVTLRSADGPGVTTITPIDPGVDPLISIGHSGVTLEGFTLRRPATQPGTLVEVQTNEGTAIVRGCSFLEGQSGLVFFDDGNLVIDSCTFEGLAGPSEGTAIGARFGQGGSLAIVNTTIASNSSEGRGVIFGRETEITIVDSFISNNSSVEGGAIFYEQGRLTLSNTTLSGNHAEQNGGGISLEEGDLTIAGGTISKNEAGAEGGGVYTRDANIRIAGAALSGNTAGSAGGGIAAEGFGGQDALEMHIDGAVFTGNEASEGEGGGISSRGLNLRIEGTIFTQNQARNGEAMYTEPGFQNSERLRMTSSALIANGGGLQGGGAIVASRGSTYLVNNVFARNIVDDAVVRIDDFVNELPPSVIAHNTFARNEQSDGPKVPVDLLELQGRAGVVSNIFRAGDAELAEFNVNFADEEIVFAFNNVQGLEFVVDSDFQATNIDADPLFVDPLADDYQLQAASPSIDAGSITLAPEDAADVDGDFNDIERLPLDADGNPRVVDGSSGEAIPDQGAFEFSVEDPEPCNRADVAVPFGVLDGADVNAFISAFGLGCP